jgi:nucleotide-binding universal stress UspA family protein
VLHVIATLDERAGALRGISYRDADHVQQLVRERVAAAFTGRSTASEVQFFVHARIGRPAEEILALARDVGADLIFIGSHGKVGLERLLLGSTCERVVREAHCPVMVARAKTYPDVQLLPVMPYEHERHAHAAPHRYSYVDNRVLLRPSDWPIS